MDNMRQYLMKNLTLERVFPYFITLGHGINS